VAFPEVLQVTTDGLAEWLADVDRPRPLLVDVRTAAEFAVSRLPGAVHLEPDGDPSPLLGEIENDRPIVLYCSVGYRSAAMAERVAASHGGEVWNLEGSIFAWANEGRPLERDAEPVREVHPYDRVWGRLLHRELRAPWRPAKAKRGDAA